MISTLRRAGSRVGRSINARYVTEYLSAGVDLCECAQKRMFALRKRCITSRQLVSDNSASALIFVHSCACPSSVYYSGTSADAFDHEGCINDTMKLSQTCSLYASANLVQYPYNKMCCRMILVMFSTWCGNFVKI